MQSIKPIKLGNLIDRLKIIDSRFNWYTHRQKLAKSSIRHPKINGKLTIEPIAAKGRGEKINKDRLTVILNKFQLEPGIIFCKEKDLENKIIEWKNKIKT